MTYQNWKMGLWLLSWSVFLTACASPKTITEYKIVSPNIPDQFKSCKQAPEPPGEGATQADAVTYILGLIEARSDCERKLEAVVRIVENE